MIDVKDRIPTYPGRVKMTPVAGQENTYDMVRADAPIEPGTPINRALFNSISTNMEAMRQQIDDKIFELTQRVRFGDLQEGAVFGLYENGVLVPFIKVTSIYDGTGTAMALRKNCVTEAVLTNVGETYYDGCRTDQWLNSEYLSSLDAATQSVIPNSYVNTTSSNGMSTLVRKVFLLSLREYFMTSNLGIPSEGGSIGYFSVKERRVSMLYGSLANHWTRSIDGYRDSAAYITPSGDHALGDPDTVAAGIRPAFQLPANYEVTVGVPNTANTVATAEVI